MFDWPVLTPLHTDPELGFDAPHFQVDGRFTTKPMNEHAYKVVMAQCPTEQYDNSDKPLEYQMADCASTIGLLDQGDTPMPTQPKWKAMRCERREIKRIWRCSETIGKIENYVSSNRAIERDGRLLCPHKGADLTTIPVDQKGFARCPMHQLLVKVRGKQSEIVPTEQ